MPFYRLERMFIRRFRLKRRPDLGSFFPLLAADLSPPERIGGLSFDRLLTKLKYAQIFVDIKYFI